MNADVVHVDTTDADTYVSHSPVGHETNNTFVCYLDCKLRTHSL
jgi:hypothetical protein